MEPTQEKSALRGPRRGRRTYSQMVKPPRCERRNAARATGSGWTQRWRQEIGGYVHRTTNRQGHNITKVGAALWVNRSKIKAHIGQEQRERGLCIVRDSRKGWADYPAMHKVHA